MSTHPSDTQLIQRIQGHDSEAFEVFYIRYRQLICNHITSIVRDDAVAQDLVQEVFLRVWTRANQWDGRGKVKGWVYRIATNLSLNHLRSMKRHPQQQLEIPADGSDDDVSIPGWMIDPSALTPEVLFEGTEQQRMVWALIEDLPPEKREVFQMVYDEEMDLQSVASALEIPEGTVKSRLYHSRKSLANKLKDLSGSFRG
jgi:RNA polymerase sigma-70 factor (ECF subfamily)